MHISTTISNWYRQGRRQWHALRARLRRQRAAVALVVLLSLSLGEPLLCIVHCQLWIPFAYQSYFAAQRPHDHHTHTAHVEQTFAAESPSPSIGGLPVRVVVPAGSPICFMGCAVNASSGVPFHVPPSPVHDIVPVLIGVIAFVLVTHIRRAAVPSDPPNVSPPLQLRPPIPFAV